MAAERVGRADASFCRQPLPVVRVRPLPWTVGGEHPAEGAAPAPAGPEQLRQWFPEEIGARRRLAGPVPARASGVRDASPVLLVHGLDEPGSIWDDLGPQLHAAGHAVWELRYPKTRASNRSAEFLARTGPGCRRAAPSRSSATAWAVWSPGFVSRLWRAGMPGPGSPESSWIGTPNRVRLGQAAGLARAARPFHDGRGAALFAVRALRDGAGEAKDRPATGQRFLDALNARPVGARRRADPRHRGPPRAPPADLGAGVANGRGEAARQGSGGNWPPGGRPRRGPRPTASSAWRRPASRRTAAAGGRGLAPGHAGAPVRAIPKPPAIEPFCSYGTGSRGRRCGGPGFRWGFAEREESPVPGAMLKTGQAGPRG